MTELFTAEEEARLRLIKIMRRMDGQDLFDDAFTALVAYEHILDVSLDAARADAESAEARLDVALKASARAFDESLDAAWAEAEAALTEGTPLTIWPGVPYRDGSRSPVRIEVKTPKPNRSQRGAQWVHWWGEGDTPTAALRALTAKLKERP